jgi:hypothetical protein
VSVIHIFIKQIFRIEEKSPTPPLPAAPTVLCSGWGNSAYFQPEVVGLVIALKQRGLGLILLMFLYYKCI